MGIMPGRPNLKTLYIMQILTEHTDEDHALNATKIGEILKRDYGIDVHRQTIYSEIGKLMDFGMDIVLNENERLGGYYLASRQFELPELKLLVDAVQSSRFITGKKTKELIGKLEKLCSKGEAKQLNNQVIIYNRPKTTNETIYYNVDKLHSAIYHNRQITYQYVDWTVKKQMEYRHGGEFYVVTPLLLIWDDENYYLVAFDEKAGRIKHYRVDKMRNMSILDIPGSQEAASQHIDAAQFEKKTFGMYGGEDEKVHLICHNSLAGVILDRFGTDIFMVPVDEEHFSASVTVAVSPQFFGWVTAVGERMRIEGPEEVKQQYQEQLHKILKNY